MKILLAEPTVPLIARDYQAKTVNESFRLWDSGTIGVLARIFTGGGKTPLACLEIRQWLQRGHDYRAMIITYEQQLVWQFAQEIEDFLGIHPGIEMGEDSLSVDDIPLIVVASRQSLLRAKTPTPEQEELLKGYGVNTLGSATKKMCEKLIRDLEAGKITAAEADEKIERINSMPNACGRYWSRLHKFDWRLNWLTVWDEAHRHAHSLKSVGHIADWFDQNPKSKRKGLTATPKRGDGKSIGHKMFPGVAIDFPLWHASRPCAVKMGWAVPYLQKYIEVEGVDFKQLKKIAGDFDDADLERVLGKEETLAKLCQPLLELVGDRQTLIFSPGIEMANDVAAYINARALCECPDCHKRSWVPTKLLGDGADCPCGFLFGTENVIRENQAKSINGTTPHRDRKEVYKGHQNGQFQFLSVCGLCREGYNDPNIACVAVFRPVSKAASSLAEQMKGRGCRPCRSVIALLNELITAEERVAAIAGSDKPNCLIVDLVGITGLADCASTIQIYAEGLPDEVAEIAEKLLAEKGMVEEVDVQEVIKTAEERAAEERQRREEAAARAKADAKAKYETADVGYGSAVDNNLATESQLKYLSNLGMGVTGPLSKAKARRMIRMLQMGILPSEVAYQNGIPLEHWEPRGPSGRQIWKLRQLNINPHRAQSVIQASQLIEAAINPEGYRHKKVMEINGCADNEGLDAIGKDLVLVREVLSRDLFSQLVAMGKAKRAALVDGGLS